MFPKIRWFPRLAAIFLLTSLVWGSEFVERIERYPSGLLKSLSNERGVQNSREVVDEAGAFRDLFEKNPPGDGFSWELDRRLEDGTHVHRIYQLHYSGRRVIDTYLKAHFNRNGWIEYVDSNHSRTFSLAPPKSRVALTSKWVRVHLLKSGRELDGEVRGEKVVWIPPSSGFPVAALVLRFLERGGLPRIVIVEEETGRVLEEKKVYRTASATVKVYKVSPSHASPESVTLSNLTDTDSLRDSYLRVRREQPDSTTSPTGVTTLDVNPIDFTAVSGFTTSPSTYSYSCEATGGSLGQKCPNQGFDAVNVYYHLNTYRSRVVSHFSTLGVSPTFSYDPLNVLINPLSISTSSNNAAYVGEPCRSDGSMDRCLIFLRPDTLSGASAQSNCSKSSSQFYDLAREALVVAHEYQHYVTDMVTGIIFSSSSTATFGDALHEGYSDYLAASHLSYANGTDVTLVGQYALQDCSPLQRQVATLRVFENGAAEEDPHTSGLSWASGLWQIREEFGVDVADLVALKSLFFLSTNPGSLEAVEALVKADKALYAGAHVTRIRDIFYNEVKFIGGSTSMFEDPLNKVADIGLKGCGAVANSGQPLKSGIASLLLFIVFLMGTVCLGRKHFFGVLFFALSSFSFANSVSSPTKFGKNCPVLSAPSPSASVVCFQKAGTEIKSATPGGNGFVAVETPGCSGYLFVTCASGLDARVQSGSVRRMTAESKGPAKKSSVMLGGHFDGPLGKPANSSTATKGLGFGVQLTYFYPVSERLYIGAGPLIEYLRLGRPMDGTGALSDPNPTNFDQSIFAFGGQLKGDYLISARDGYGTGPEWWARLGLEYWWPLSSKQTDTTGDEVTYTPGKFLVATLGAVMDINLSQSTSLATSAEGFYNVGRLSAPTFYGVRVAVALRYSL